MVERKIKVEYYEDRKVLQVILDFVKEKQKEYPGYCKADVIRKCTQIFAGDKVNEL